MVMEIVGLCNPLLDLSVEVPIEYLQKYNLNENDAILASKEHLPIYDEISKNEKVVYGAGGSGQNSLRIAQWLMQEAPQTVFFGAVGEDNFAKVMQTQAEKQGLLTKYYTQNVEPTGSCAVLINGHHRSMVANLAAANTFQAEHLDKPENWALIQQAHLFYITGFFHTVSPSSIMRLAKHCSENSKLLCMNLSAPFLFQVPPFFQSFCDALPYVNVYFGNEDEFSALGTAMGWTQEEGKSLDDTLEDVARRLTLLYTKQGEEREERGKYRIVVQTHGSRPTLVVVGNAKEGIVFCQRFPIIPIAPEDIVDTNGCGDAFVGGFLVGLRYSLPVDKCIALANYAANVVIKHVGCDYPHTPTIDVNALRQ